jgi:DNA-binding CsgD family transcriptional regulator
MQGIAEQYLGDGWIHRDERYKSVPMLLHRGVGTEFDFTSPDEMKRTPFYANFLDHHGLRWYAGVKVGDGDDVWGLAIQRTIAQGPFQPSEVEQLAVLSRHLAGIPQLASALGSARVDATLHGFDASGAAAAVIDRFGIVVRTNGSAERLLGADLSIVQGRVVSSNRQATNALDRALSELFWRPDGAPTQPPVILPRRQGRPVLAYLSRLPGIGLDVFSPGRGCIVFTDLDARSSPPTEDLVAIFGLTPAEARLAVQMIADDSLEKAAETLGISYETARTSLKNVFRKTDTSRQLQLAVLLSRMRRGLP